MNANAEMGRKADLTVNMCLAALGLSTDISGWLIRDHWQAHWIKVNGTCTSHMTK